MVAFERARFSGGRVTFDGTSFSGDTVDLSAPAIYDVPPTFEDCTIRPKCPGPNLERTDHADRLRTDAKAPVMGARVYRRRGRPHTIVPAGCGPRSPQHGKSSDAGRQQC